MQAARLFTRLAVHRPSTPRRLVASAVAVVALTIAIVVPVLAKGGAVVTFVGSFPRDAEPGTTVTLTWDLRVPDGEGGLHPWGGTPVGIRLDGPTGTATEAMGGAVAGVEGRYSADLLVPAGGIAAVEAFMRGDANGARSDLPVAIEPNPLAAETTGAVTGAPAAGAPATGAASAAPVPATAPSTSGASAGAAGLIAVLVVLAACVTVVLRRRLPRPADAGRGAART